VVRLLVLTSEPVSADQLRTSLPSDADPTDAEVMVVVPALQESALRFWMSDADDAIARAEEVRAASMEKLGEAGVAASGDTGEGDPEEAIEDALKTFPADRILLFTRGGDDQRYRENVDPEALQSRFGIPVSHSTV
jgi:nucleotide-binding universal stress UspA family protein